LDRSGISTQYKIDAWDYNASTGVFSKEYTTTTTDGSGGTGLTMFDFNSDNIAELVYRDEDSLRIMRANSLTGHLDNLATFPGGSGTIFEYPIVVDAYQTGSARIVVISSNGSGGFKTNSSLRIYASAGNPWAAGRKVWNQYSYNPTFVNNDLTIPANPVNPSIIMPGADGLIGTGDDVQPYNSFQQQVTVLDTLGIPIFLLPDGRLDREHSSLHFEGDSASLRVCITNQGDAALGKPAYVSLYKDYAVPDSLVLTDSVDVYIYPGDTVCLNIAVPHVSDLLPFTRFVVRLNDRQGAHPHQLECDASDSIVWYVNPELPLLMRKDATLNSVRDNGAYPNPVAIMNLETATYDLTIYNTNLSTSSTLYITDTLPAYMDYVTGSSPTATVGSTSGTPSRTVLQWTYNGISQKWLNMSYQARTQSGANASQPLYINRVAVKSPLIELPYGAGVPVPDSVRVISANSTYHQGAGVSLVTFSAAVGGSIFNAEPQAVDYHTTVRSSSLLVAPDSGYVFAGWSHPEYISHRGVEIPAASGVLDLDTLLIYGNVELTAVFAKDENLNKVPNLVKVDDDASEEAVVSQIWSSGGEIFVIPAEKPSVLRIYSAEGLLIRQQTLLTTNLFKHRLPKGIYVVTLNGGAGQKVVIE
jgi:hypothetical protein